MSSDRRFRLPRLWSNGELRRLAPLFPGDVVNVSAWEDGDKEGARYRDYFTAASSYTLTNFGRTRGAAAAGEAEIMLDLGEELPEDLRGHFDVVFNHTTLEHIYEVRRAFANLCAMSRDVVIVVVPFAQAEHTTDSFGDFWRFAPGALRTLAAENGLSIVYESESPDRDAGIYLLIVAVRNAQYWRGRMPHHRTVVEAGRWIGAPRLRAIASRLKAAVSGRAAS
jgi:hypothetical protein